MCFLGQYKVICYYTNWSWYRPGEGKYEPSDIDVNLCTHVLFGFATLDPIQLTMKVFDSWSDTDEKGPWLYAQVTALKASGVKKLIALGGWNDSVGYKYSLLVNDPGARKRPLYTVNHSRSSTIYLFAILASTRLHRELVRGEHSLVKVAFFPTTRYSWIHWHF